MPSGHKADVAKELKAIQVIVRILETLTPATQLRVLKYCASRCLGPKPPDLEKEHDS